ncbi:NAD(P)H-hydrate dehydratase [Endomicrobium proavitum]|uniref:ADP-dependent (S)-NAD(P)H-hydrate dehydratase n=1 Tax=Endomicrobium proavitum TaxID=1408281 RepID=A0A0G3WL61_9BACT|nr:NAD(P)H-hydrate dehydratase [Endomicrobium proavitum]AKL98239.1 ADP-dependent (S)-NAD(P)H-hydrate dehydratase [Endomicrobium proavitum]
MDKKIEGFSKNLKRSLESNKYDYGHVLVIAGSKTMPGAGVLCCNAALRAGAGLVTYAVEEKFLLNAQAVANAEIMFFVYSHAQDIINFIKAKKVSAVVLGPGMVLNYGSLYALAKEIICSVNIPIVLDASALSAFNEKTDEFKYAKAKLVLTPHIGEFKALLFGKNNKLAALNSWSKEIMDLKVRKNIVKKFAKDHSIIFTLKGHNTAVSDGESIYVNDSGTPAMATAGSGDVLGGIIAAFACVSRDLYSAVCAAVFIHALSGELAEKEKGVTSVIASDIIENIPNAIIKHFGKI